MQYDFPVCHSHLPSPYTTPVCHKDLVTGMEISGASLQDEQFKQLKVKDDKN